MDGVKIALAVGMISGRNHEAEKGGDCIEGSGYVIPRP